MLFCFLAGCAKNNQLEKLEQICAPNLDKTQAMRLTKSVLSQMHFKIAKFDTQAGYIRTQPLSAAQFFEFWRKDNIGTENWAKANLHSIRRTAELQINQTDGQICLDCIVTVQRLVLPDIELENNRRGLEKLKLKTKQKEWIDLQKDEKLATVILTKIKKKADNRSF